MNFGGMVVICAQVFKNAILCGIFVAGTASYLVKDLALKAMRRSDSAGRGLPARRAIFPDGNDSVTSRLSGKPRA